MSFLGMAVMRNSVILSSRDTRDPYHDTPVYS